jgi:ribose transport system permease protein
MTSALLRRFAGGQQLGIILIIAVLLLVAQLANPVALTAANLIEVLRSTAIIFIAAAAATLLLVGGGLDLSNGSVFAVGAVATGMLLNAAVPWPAAVLGGVAVGAVFGSANAVLIVAVQVPPFITTLGMYFAASGIVTVVTSGNPRSGFPDGFTDLGQLNLFGVPFLVFYALIVGVVFHVVLDHTRFGYDTRAVGGNAKAALANGVRAGRVNAALYVTSAAVAALGGILFAARVSTADPGSGGTAFTFQVLAAVIIGGTSLFGGIGTITGTALGALLFSVINNALVLTHTNPQWQNVATGVVLVAAVAFDKLRRDRQFKVVAG